VGENVFGAEQYEDYYTIEEQTRVNVRRFRTEAISYTIRFQNIEHMTSFTIGDVLNHIIERQLTGVNPLDYVGFEMNHACMSRRVLVPFSKRESVSADKVLSLMERIQQSKEEFTFGSNIEFKMIVVHQN
jgi:hypothetical protein